MSRLSKDEAWLRCAEVIALRSTCTRLQVGALCTDAQGLQVLGVGYNGNARGLPNTCDSTEAGHCGCIHAELNALLKAPGAVPDKVLYVTHAPCLACAKLVLNANVYRVVYRHAYRLTDGVDLLQARWITVVRR